MKKVLFISNIQVPYRIKFFNELSKSCDLTVLYERSKSSNRNDNWTKSCREEYKKIFLDGLNIGNESSFSFRIIKYISGGKFDVIIIGCPESRVQRFAILYMRLFKIKYIVNLDCETFLAPKGIKNKIKLFLLKGAKKYIIAGEKSAVSLENLIGIDKQFVTTYYFSSLYNAELQEARIRNSESIRENFVLVV